MVRIEQYAEVDWEVRWDFQNGIKNNEYIRLAKSGGMRAPAT